MLLGQPTKKPTEATLPAKSLPSRAERVVSVDLCVSNKFESSEVEVRRPDDG